MSNALATADWDSTKMDLVKRTIAKGCDDDELALFGMVCKRTDLDPFQRQIYARKQWDGKLQREVMIIITSIDGFRLQAQRSGKYAGQLGPQWCGPDGVWKDVWTGDGYPFAARVGVLRSDFAEPLWSVAKWNSYVQTYKDKQSGKVCVTQMWDRMSDHMLAKCAEALSLRRACPNELSGIYAEEEADQMANEREPVPAKREVEPRSKPTVKNASAAEAASSPSLPSGASDAPDFHKTRFSEAVARWSKMKGADLTAARNDAAKRFNYKGASGLTEQQYSDMADGIDNLIDNGEDFFAWASQAATVA